MKVLQVIESAYRCNLEEQDDPAVWITHAMKDAGAVLDVVLMGNGVNYAVRGQNAEGLSFGDKDQTKPPRIERDVGQLLEKGLQVYLVQDDVAERGLEPSELIEGTTPVTRKALAKLFADYDHVWYW